MSDLIRNPQGRVTGRIREVGEAQVVISIIVAAELRWRSQEGIRTPHRTGRGGARRHGSSAIRRPADRVYGAVRARLEQKGQVIGGNDLLIAAQAISLGFTLVTANKREFAKLHDLLCENWLD